MSTTIDLSGRRPPTRRTWLALAGTGAAVLVLLALIAVACQARSNQLPAALDSPAPTASGSAPAVADESDVGELGGQPGGGQPGGGQPGGGQPEPGDSPAPGGEDPPGDDGEPDPVEPAAKDCISYDATDIGVEPTGGDWRVRIGSSSFKVFASQGEANDAAWVARHWTRRCFIGRGNDRDDRYRYIAHYFEQSSNLPALIMPAHDCISYDPPNLGISHHAGDWWLLDGPAELLPLASQADAERARAVASDHSRLCYIGRGNDRPDHDRYTMSYWLP